MPPPLHIFASDLSIDQKLALKTAATRLQNEFADMFGVETIERFLHSSYDQFATRASIANFLPLLAERFARQRLRALAKVEGKSSDGKPIVLFLCTHNAGPLADGDGILRPHGRRCGRGLVGRLRTRQ